VPERKPGFLVDGAPEKVGSGSHQQLTLLILLKIGGFNGLGIKIWEHLSHDV